MTSLSSLLLQIFYPDLIDKTHTPEFTLVSFLKELWAFEPFLSRIYTRQLCRPIFETLQTNSSKKSPQCNGFFDFKKNLLTVYRFWPDFCFEILSRLTKSVCVNPFPFDFSDKSTFSTDLWYLALVEPKKIGWQFFKCHLEYFTDQNGNALKMAYLAISTRKIDIFHWIFDWK